MTKPKTMQLYRVNVKRTDAVYRDGHVAVNSFHEIEGVVNETYGYGSIIVDVTHLGEVEVVHYPD